MDTEPPTLPLTSAGSIHPEDLDDEWAVNEAKPGIRLRWLTAALLVLAALGGGFWGGVVAERHHGSGSNAATSSLASRFAAARAAAGRVGGATGAGGLGFAGTGGFGGTPATSGTVVGVSGNVLYVSDSAGNLVKVDVGAATTVTRTAQTPLSGLQVGDTVVVSGSSGPGGTVNATSVRAVARTGGPAPGGSGG
jgi:hypothetical protein